MLQKFVNVSTDEFFNTFLRNPDGLASRKYTGAFKAMPEEGVPEEYLYLPFRKCLEDAKLCPGYQCVLTANAPDRDDKFKQKVDAALFLEKDAPTDGRQHWARQAISFEFKKSSMADDPFQDDKEDLEHDSEQGNKNRGQIISYAAETFARQHRTFCFTVIILGNCARIIRWDRSGAVFTEKFDYKRKPFILGKFLWRFSHHSLEAQGYDPSATMVTEGSDYYNLMTQYANTKLTSGDYVREFFKKSLEAGWPWWSLQVNDELPTPRDVEMGRLGVAVGAHTASEAPRATRPACYLVGKPHFIADGMVGRGTRGYVALDCQTSKFVFLKDSWRVDHEDIEKEGEVLRRLNDVNVRNVPTLVCHGDVLGQRTKTQDVWESVYGSVPVGNRPVKLHMHYRLVVEEVGHPLSDFKDGYELVSIMSDCLTAHRQAYERLRLLHRDISSGNVFFVERIEGDAVVPVGYLSDWELSKTVPKGGENHVARQPDRTGTWQFMSALSLQNPYKPITLQDDLESFVHLVVYEAIRFLPHNIPAINVGTFIWRYFDAAIPYNGEYYVCGDKKWSTMKDGELEDTSGKIIFGGHECYPLNVLLNSVSKWFSAYYAVLAREQPDLFRRDLIEVPAEQLAGEDSSDQPVKRRKKRAPNVGRIDFSKLVSRRDRLKEVQIQLVKDDAEELKDHYAICSAFDSILELGPWRENDKCPDKLPADYDLHKETQKVRAGSKRTADGPELLQSKKWKPSASGGKSAMIPLTDYRPGSDLPAPIREERHPLFPSLSRQTQVLEKRPASLSLSDEGERILSPAEQAQFASLPPLTPTATGAQTLHDSTNAQSSATRKRFRGCAIQ
ncbi:predicted protein [Sparassis crispa]|uniref:Protein kinase domain-containing protein n=1 Tax=Sparassis crispa TaxID=139825 RepID=A0A401GW09_9APHY|nr:predicted protein [Sparassis crispa]GBE86380.1 predicted protein [Sparassis crispa]